MKELKIILAVVADGCSLPNKAAFTAVARRGGSGVRKNILRFYVRNESQEETERMRSSALPAAQKSFSRLDPNAMTLASLRFPHGTNAPYRLSGLKGI